MYSAISKRLHHTYMYLTISKRLHHILHVFNYLKASKCRSSCIQALFLKRPKQKLLHSDVVRGTSSKKLNLPWIMFPMS